MTRLSWGTTGERYFEAGVDRGVLFVGNVDEMVWNSSYPNMEGVAWNGLVAVKEAPSGGVPTPFFYDGFKYRQLAAAEEFTATIEALSAPRSFEQCDGSSQMSNGLFATQQPRKQFSLSYRTKIGSDLASDLAYKIHLVYNALAAPTQQNNSTLSNTITPITFSWAISTAPVRVPGFKPTSHFVVDSRYTAPDILAELEDILYGTDLLPPRLITPEELANMFGLVIRDLGGGRYSAEGYAVKNVIPGFSFTIDHSSLTDNGDGSFTIVY